MSAKKVLKEVFTESVPPETRENVISGWILLGVTLAILIAMAIFMTPR